MHKTPALWPDMRTHLMRQAPVDPVIYFSPLVLQQTYAQFVAGFSGLVTYAVKANDSAMVLDNLVAAGMTAFDVASPAEMAKVRAALPSARLHYHNPVRSRAEIDIAKGYGIASWSIDRLDELEKLGDLPEGTEIAVRLALPVQGAAYDFGSKFGATPDTAIDLLRRVAAKGLCPSITFHPGTQCHDPAAWGAYIRAAAEVARRAGVTLTSLNVGGGFAVYRDHRPDWTAIFDHITEQAEAAFDIMPRLVGEPGRAMVGESFALALRVKSVRSDGAIYLNDGIYGGLYELRDIAAPTRYHVLRGASENTDRSVERIVFGPTCDSVDRIPEPLPLPTDVAEDDVIVFPAMGAYCAALATRFNGYGVEEVISVMDLSF